MVDLSKTLALTRCKTCVIIDDKTQALEVVSKLIAQDLLISYRQILAKFEQRERVATTALGGGIAIPHARVFECKQPITSLVQLQTAQDFGAQDGIKVDLIFGLVVPEQATSSHLDLLKQIAKVLNSKGACINLRNAKTAEQLWQIVADFSC